MNIALILTLILGLHSVSCAQALVKDTSSEKDPKPSMTPEEKWSSYLQGVLSKDTYAEAWALLSSSSMEDSGQTMVYKIAEGDKARLEIVGRNSVKVQQTLAIEGQPWVTFKELVKNDNLEDFTDSFDGVTYTYVHYKKNGPKIVLVKRITMINPSTSPVAEKQAKFVSEFLKLRALGDEK